MTGPRPHPAVETSFLDNEAALFDERTGAIHHLNLAASSVWLLLDGDLDADALAHELADIFEQPLDVVRPDVDAALADFTARGLLDGSPAPIVGGHVHDAVAAAGPTVLARPPDP